MYAVFDGRGEIEAESVITHWMQSGRTLGSLRRLPVTTQGTRADLSLSPHTVPLRANVPHPLTARAAARPRPLLADGAE